jgi:hypothetical protein
VNRAIHFSVKNLVDQTSAIQGVEALKFGRNHVHGEVSAAHFRAGVPGVFPGLVLDRHVNRVKVASEFFFDGRLGGLGSRRHVGE